MKTKHTTNLQIFGREHLNVNTDTQTEIIKRYNSQPELLEALQGITECERALSLLINGAHISPQSIESLRLWVEKSKQTITKATE